MAEPTRSTRSTRTDRFTFVCTPEEREQVDTLARLLEREPSDAVRFVIRQKIAELENERESA